MTQSITLSASMRSNLSALQALEKQLQTTQTRLATGKKVNSAIDDAASFFQASELTRRAAKLDTLLDNMGQGIQTIQAANQGIEAITAYAEQANSILSAAQQVDPNSEGYGTMMNSYKEQFNAIMDEIANIAKDSSYNGISLLTGRNLDIVFSDSSTTGSKTTIVGEDVVDKMGALGFQKLDWGDIDQVKGNLATAQQEFAEVDAPVEATGDAVEGATYYTLGEDGSYTVVERTVGEAVGEGVFTDDGTYAAKKAALSTAEEAFSNISASMESMMAAITDSIDYLQTFSNNLSSQFSLIETRQSFTEAMIDILETGADNLVLADMNEESANYLALQTRQQLAINALALAAQSEQSVLKLF